MWSKLIILIILSECFGIVAIYMLDGFRPKNTTFTAKIKVRNSFPNLFSVLDGFFKNPLTHVIARVSREILQGFSELLVKRLQPTLEIELITFRRELRRRTLHLALTIFSFALLTWAVFVHGTLTLQRSVSITGNSGCLSKQFWD